jgi:hypothetical protein
MFHKGFDRAAVVGYLSPMAFEGSRDDTGHEIQEVFARITDVSQMISFFEEIFTSRRSRTWSSGGVSSRAARGLLRRGA